MNENICGKEGIFLQKWGQKFCQKCIKIGKNVDKYYSSLSLKRNLVWNPN